MQAGKIKLWEMENVDLILEVYKHFDDVRITWGEKGHP